MNISQHANVRAQQRGFTGELIYLIRAFGTKTRRPGGAWEVMITRKNKRSLINKIHNKQLLQLLDKADGKALLIGNDETIITAYIKN